MVALTVAAGATSSVGLATGVLVLSEHNPMILAKTAASLDVLSQGRLSPGIGVAGGRSPAGKSPFPALTGICILA